MKRTKYRLLCGFLAFAVASWSSYGLRQYTRADVTDTALINAEFEGSADGFESRGTASVKLVSSVSYEGSKCLCVSDRTSAWQGAMLSLDTYGFISGSTYNFSSMVMYDTGEDTEEISMTMQYSNSSGETVYDHMAKAAVPKNKWTTLSADNFTMPADASDIILYFETPVNTIDFYIDNVMASAVGSGEDPRMHGIIYGDVNNDDLINLIDFIMLRNMYLDKEDYLSAADLDADGSLTSKDIMLMCSYLLGKTDSFPAQTAKPPVTDPPQTEDPDEYDKKYTENVDADTLKMYQDSLLNVGNTTRILKKIQDAKAGRDVTIGYIGGSITEGFSAGDSLCYAKRSYEYFAQEFGTGNNVKYINAGLSGTSSVVGNLRANRDMLCKKPDIIFIEFSVNDQGSVSYQKSFESLVKKCLLQENDPAVIILITRSETGGSCQPQMAAVAQNYDLAAISVDNALTNALKSGKMKWSDYGNDQFHPHVAGHQLIADFIGFYYRQAQLSKNRVTSYEIPQKAVYGDEYTWADMVSQSELGSFNAGSFKKGTSIAGFSDGWTYSKNGNTPMTFTIEGKGLFILFKSNQTQSMGTLQIDVNGKKSQISANKLYTWGGPDADVAYIQDLSAVLNVSITMDQTSKDFEILAIGVIK
ncbi:MAG: carbohydrate binding domain-containing protein [Oscillospiraceae bacterium]|nr:carbohydrate binding domain-containing protein [Oscillospiraceae bacterium]